MPSGGFHGLQVPRTQLAALEDEHHLTPVVDEILRSRLADAAHDQGPQPALHRFELALRQRQVPGVPIAYLDVAKARRV